MLQWIVNGVSYENTNLLKYIKIHFFFIISFSHILFLCQSELLKKELLLKL